MRFIERLLDADPSLRPVELGTRVRERFGIKVHPRSIERVLARQKKTSVTQSAPSTSHPLTADYEALRQSAQTTERSGAHFGLVLLLREGLAAWIAHVRSGPVTVTPAPSERATVAPIIMDEVRADIVAVLASMIQVHPEEQRA